MNNNRNDIKRIACELVLAIMCMCCLLVLSSCAPKIDVVSSGLSTYNLDLSFDDSTKVLTGIERVDYINSASVPLNEVHFHLYPNAFRSDAKIRPVSSITKEKAYPNGFSEGKIDIKSVKTTQAQEVNIGGEDKNILIVGLDSELFPDERTSITIEFEVLLPSCNHRFGYGESTYNFGNFYPIACVYEDGAFREDAYVSSGDPFYSQMANYNVSIDCDSDFVLASTGKKGEVTTIDNRTATNISASVVRDFAFVLSKKYQVIESSINKTSVFYFYYDDPTPQRSLDTAVASIKTFSNLFGEYPYSTFSVCKTNFVHGGMEYPNLVYISDSIEDYDEYLNVIVHESAHQWWYNLVGSDAINNAWQDEGLTEFSTLMFYRYNTGYNINEDESLSASLSSYLLFSEIYESVYGSFDSSMSRALKDFSGDMDYTYVTYVKGVLFFDNLEEIVGKKNFLKALKNYYKQNVYKIASVDNMIACFEQTCKRSLESYFDSWISGKVVLQNIK